VKKLCNIGDTLPEYDTSKLLLTCHKVGTYQIDLPSIKTIKNLIEGSANSLRAAEAIKRTFIATRKTIDKLHKKDVESLTNNNGL
jgi:hypothetical protein